ncbi:hypothetical protein [Saccharomonospora iraqiensis]|uniref:hypothetical protein n=1 Tax=Saccharomonospora iraqiensis TaxID=52698 RepID=UPI00022E11BA|nr:hypothetical protein [Saccharomonospora iraqiensis]
MLAVRIHSALEDVRQVVAGGIDAIREDLADVCAEVRTGFSEVRSELDSATTVVERTIELLNMAASGWADAEDRD